MAEWRTVRNSRTGRTEQRRNVISWRTGNLGDTKGFKNRKVRSTRALISADQYNVYIESDEWAERRALYFKTHRQAPAVSVWNRTGT